MVRTSAASSCTALRVLAEVSKAKGRWSHAERDPGSHGDRHATAAKPAAPRAPRLVEPARQEGRPAHQHQDERPPVPRRGRPPARGPLRRHPHPSGPRSTSPSPSRRTSSRNSPRTTTSIITGVGDCGSCSAAAAADGVVLEAAGVPVAAIITDSFKPTADAMAALRGAPGYKYATTAHPVAVLTEDKVKERAAPVLDDVVALLTDTGRTQGKPRHDRADATDGAAADARRHPTPTRRSAPSSTATSRAGPTDCRSSRSPRRCSTQFLATTSKDPDEIIGVAGAGRPGRQRAAPPRSTPRWPAASPSTFPVVLAAFEALMRERAARGGGFQSTSGPSPLIVVNGPIRQGTRLQHRGRRVRPRLPAQRHHPARHRPHRPQRVRRPPARP